LFEEINKHGDLILRKAKISNRDFIALLTLFQKHTKIVKKEFYLDKTPVAEEIMKEIDITDSPFLASALALNCLIWSNDGHFKQQNLVKVYTTKEKKRGMRNENIVSFNTGLHTSSGAFSRHHYIFEELAKRHEGSARAAFSCEQGRCVYSRVRL